ncbi:MAG: PAS domain-containing protein [Deltaproteobacteria bacterium]|nr:PAS domain-containing protein [Deltaproteobacteria bacterium]
MRVRFIIAVFVTVLLGVVASGAFLSSELKKSINIRSQKELENHAALMSVFVSELLDSDTISDGMKIARKAADKTDMRVTIILSDGKVIGDSELTIEDVVNLENHGSRPEVIKALKSGNGFSHRYSATVEYEMLYAAKTFKNSAVKGVVRVSRPLKDINKTLHVLYGTLALAALIFLGLAALMAIFFSNYFTTVLRRIVSDVQNLAEGKGVIDPDGVDKELGGLTYSLKKMASNLESSVHDLASERDRFEAVLDGMNESVIALDNEKRVTVINSSALDLFELSSSPIGKDIIEILRVPHFLKLISNLEKKETKSTEFEIGGSAVKIMHARATGLISGGCVIVLLDVTDLRRLERMRRDFVSNVSHELRTPIAVLRANSDTLLEGALDDKEMAVKFLNSISSNSDRLSRLIDDLLDLSKIEEGKLHLDIVSLKLGEFFKRAKGNLETKASKRYQTINIEKGEDISVMADEGALDQIFFNLLDNAVKYGGEKAVITVRAALDNNHVTVEIEDNGPGIDEIHKDRLFERFYRVDKGRSKELGGTGLGLAIVKHLVDSLGGEAGMRQAPLKGSIFWFTLPVSMS